MSDKQLLIIAISVGFIQLVMLFAQVKLFEINSTMKEVRDLLEKIAKKS